MSSIVCSLQHVSVGRLHATQTVRNGESITFDLKACYGASGCMRDNDPSVGKVSIVWDDDLKMTSVNVEVSGNYPNLYYGDVLSDIPRLIQMAQMSISRLGRGR